MLTVSLVHMKALWVRGEDACLSSVFELGMCQSVSPWVLTLTTCTTHFLSCTSPFLFLFFTFLHSFPPPSSLFLPPLLHFTPSSTHPLAFSFRLISSFRMWEEEPGYKATHPKFSLPSPALFPLSFSLPTSPSFPHYDNTAYIHASAQKIILEYKST